MVYMPVVMVLYKDGDQHVNKSTNNDHFVVTFPSFYVWVAESFPYASIMLNAYSDPLCSKLCWLNRLGPSQIQ